MYQTKQEKGTGFRRVPTTTERNVVTRVKRGTNVGKLVFQLVVVLSGILALLLTLGYDPIPRLIHITRPKKKEDTTKTEDTFGNPPVKIPEKVKKNQITVAVEEPPEVPSAPPRAVPSLQELAKSEPPRDPHYWEDLSTHIKYRIGGTSESTVLLNATEIVGMVRSGMLDSIAIRVVSFPEPEKTVFTTLSTLLMSTLDKPSVNVHTVPREDVNTTAYYEGFRGLLRGHVIVTPSLPEDTPMVALERTNYVAALRGFLQKQNEIAKQPQVQTEENAHKPRPVRGVLLLRDSVRVLPHGLEQIYAHMHVLERSGQRNFVLSCATAEKGIAPTSSEDFNLVTSPEGIPQVVAKWLRDQPKPVPWFSMANPVALPVRA